MTLREFLDEVTFGNAARLCVAVKGEDDFLDYYEEGKYWELPAGNWENGSNSKACPVIPEKIMEAEVAEVDASPNLRYVYKHLGELYGHSLDTTVILVDAWDFDVESYWEENELNPIPVRCVEDYNTEWPYAISTDLWEEIQDMTDNCQLLSQAIYNIPLVGIQTITEYSEEDFEKMDAYSSQLMRLGQKIAMKVSRLEEVLSLIQLADMVNAFNCKHL